MTDVNYRIKPSLSDAFRPQLMTESHPIEWWRKHHPDLVQLLEVDSIDESIEFEIGFKTLGDKKTRHINRWDPEKGGEFFITMKFKNNDRGISGFVRKKVESVIDHLNDELKDGDSVLYHLIHNS